MKLSSIDKLLEKLVQIGISSLIIVIPVYLKFPLFEVPGTYVFVRVEDFLIAIVTFLWIAWMRLRIWNFIRKYRIFQIILLFWIVTAISSVSAIFLTNSVQITQVILHYTRYVEYMIILFIAFTSITSRAIAWWYLKLIGLTIALVFVYGMGQYFYGWPIISTMNREYAQGVAQSTMPGGRINSTFAGHYDLAAYVVLMLNLVAGMIVLTNKWWKLIPVCIWGMSFWLMIVSASRISFAAYLISITITLFLIRKWLWLPLVYTISILSFFQTPELMDRYAQTIKYEFAPRLAFLNQSWLNRDNLSNSNEQVNLPSITATPYPTTVANSGDGGVAPNIISTPTPTPTLIIDDRPPVVVEIREDRSTAIRFQVEWPRAIRAMTKNPPLGTGYSSITLATDNNYLRIVGETGLLSLLIWILIICEYIFILLKSSKSHWSTSTKIYSYSMLGATIGFLANAVFIDVFAASKVAIYFWLLMGVNLGLIITDKNNKDDSFI